MKVCLDIQPAIAQRAGVGRYVKALAERLGRFAAGDELTLFHFDFRRRGLEFETPGARVRAVGWVPGRLVQQAWKRLGAPPYDWFAGRADLYHFPNFIRPPLARGRSVVTLHDLSFVRFPEAAEPKNLAYLTARIGDTVRRADAILADSETIAAEIVEHFRLSPDRVFPVVLGLEETLARPPEPAVDAVRRRLGLERPYLLHVGTLEPRKNIAFLVEVFERLADFDGDLALAGGLGWRTEPILERIARSPRAARIRRLGRVADGDLPALYAGASAFVFPSLYEGFGFPPLEAMACGTPVIASPRGSLREVLGDGAALVEDFDADAWAERLRAVLGDAVRRGALVAAGRARAARYRWDDTALRTWEVYRKAASA